MAGKTIYIVCGEASGDLHAAHLVQALKNRDASLKFRGTGGEHLYSTGMYITRHIRDMNFMGFMEILKNLLRILSILKQIKKDIQETRPDAVLLVDYPGFNLKLAPFIHSLGIPVYYYISPQLWAWKKGRIQIIRKYVKQMFVILPFEEKFYREENIEAEFLGHPLMDILQQIPADRDVQANTDTKPVLALLPGSRKQEIQRILPVLLATAAKLPEFTPVLACAPAIDESVYLKIPGAEKVLRVKGNTHKLLAGAAFAFVASGTATLEAAILNVPQIVCYKADAPSVYLARKWVKVKYISLVNLILDTPALPELIQEDLTPEHLLQHFREMTQNPERHKVLMENYELLRNRLGGKGCAGRTADKLLSLMK